MTETSHKATFINTVAKKSHKTLKLIFLCLTASPKFHSAIVAFHHPTLVGNYQALHSDVFALSILWIVYHLPVLLSVWGMRFIAVTWVVFEVYIAVFESRYSMTGIFIIKHFCGGFLDGKMTAWLNGETKDLFSFLLVHQRGVLRK